MAAPASGTWAATWRVVLALALGCGAAPSTVYREASARAYLEFARASFCLQGRLEDWDCGDSCEANRVVPGSVRLLGETKKWHLQGFVAQLPPADSTGEAGSQCVVAIRGSVDIENYMSDFMAWPTSWPDWPGANTSWCPGCKVHAGFAGAYQELRPALLEAVEELSCTSLVLSGHSLGGALVSLAALELRRSRRTVEVWTFGKPRLGNEVFAETFAQAARETGTSPPLWRVVHYLDPVPRLPPAGVYGYIHEGQEVYYTTRTSSAFRVCSHRDWDDTPWEDPTCSSASSIFSCLGSPGFDHNMYLNKTLDYEDMSSQCLGATAVYVLGFHI